MKLASVILAILAGGVAAPAQWATNAWPSWDRPFRGIQRKDDVTNALTERCLAAKASLGDLGTLSGWFKQRRALVVCKATLKDLVGSYVDTDQADPDGSLDTWFAGGEAGPPMLTVTAVLSRAGAQSNYLDVTPWFDLSAASNGWRYVTGVVAQLRWTLSQRVYCPATNQLIGIHTGDSTNQALANALWYWPEWRGVESDWPAFKWNEMAGPFVGGLWHCNVYSLTNVLQAYGLWTGAAHSVDYYYKMRALNDWEVYYLYSDYPAGGYAGSPCTWDDQGDSCVHADLARYGQDAEGTYSNAPGIGIGNTNFPGNFVENYVAGWILTTNYGVVKWDVSTNGFKFR